MTNVIQDAIIGIASLFIIGVSFASSTVKPLIDAGIWLLGAGLIVLVAVIAAIFIAITKN